MLLRGRLRVRHLRLLLLLVWQPLTVAMGNMAAWFDQGAAAVFRLQQRCCCGDVRGRGQGATADAPSGLLGNPIAITVAALFLQG